ncbi:sirohydrochlorin chelatase [Yimella sp. cx-573]|nr:sirohydrochlorin chelatase [Yimella sp. cx-573]
MTTALVVCAHGTDNPAGQDVVRSITEQVRRRLPSITVRDAYVDVQIPALPDVVNELVAQHDSVVIVPLLLSSGFHTEVDVADVVAAHAHVVAAPALGPHELLGDVLVDRLHEAGAEAGDPVVLAVAGSSRPSGAADAEVMLDLLRRRWGGPVSLGYLAAREPSVSDAVTAARTDRQQVAVASYLIGPGFFHDRLQRVVDVLVSEPLGDDARLAELVLLRFAEASQPVDAR